MVSAHDSNGTITVMRNFFAHASLLSFFLVSVAPSVADTLCQKDEVTFFNCEIKGSAKVASLCGSPQLDAHRGYVQYRFGRVGKIELTFPQERQTTNTIPHCEIEKYAV